MNRPSLGLFTYSTEPRGSVVHAAHLAEALTRARWDVTLYALAKDGRRFFRSVAAKLELVPAGPAPATTAELVVQRAHELSRFLEQRRVRHDVLHAEDCLTANALLGFVASRGGPPVVRTVHHVERFTDERLVECQEASIRGADHCFAVSRAVELDVARAFGVRATRVTNGVAFGRFEHRDESRVRALRKRFRLGEDPVVLASGGVEPRKNTVRTLNAFAGLVRRVPDARLVIMGGATVLDHGSYRAAYDAALSALPTLLRARVHELGVVEDADVPPLFHLASVLAFPSLQEGFGLVALEALAAGLPVVASSRAPLTELLDGAVATMVDPESEASIEAGLIDAFSAPRERVARGRARARAYSWERVASLHAEAYAALLSSHGRRETKLHPNPSAHPELGPGPQRSLVLWAFRGPNPGRRRPDGSRRP